MEVQFESKRTVEKKFEQLGNKCALMGKKVVFSYDKTKTLSSNECSADFLVGM